MESLQPTVHGKPGSSGAKLSQPLALDGSLLVMRGFNLDHDLEGLCQLFSEVFSQPMDQDHWRWKYQQAPNSQHYHAIAADVRTGRLLGHMGVIILRGVRSGKAIRMAHATDLMISPLARSGIGPHSVYRHIMHTVRERALDAGPDAAPLFMYGFPGRRPATLAMRLGIQRRLQICTQYILPDAMHSSRWAEWWAQTSYWRLQALPQPPTEQFWSEAVLNPIWERRAYELAAQAQTDPARACPSLVKDAAYLRWRYLQHPQQSRLCESGRGPLYTLWLLRRRGQPPCGWVVTRLQPQPTVVDSCLPGGLEAVASALRALPVPATQTSASTAWACRPLSRCRLP